MRTIAISRISIVAVTSLLVVAVFSGYAVGDFSNHGSNLTVTSTSVSTKIATSISTVTSTMVVAASTQTVNQAAGVKLQVSLNSTNIFDNPSQNTSSTILVTLSEYNILPHENNLTASNGWPLANLSVGGCDFHEPFGIAVYKGNYSLQNVSSASSIDVFERLLGCPFPSLSAKYYSFLPDSNLATIITSPYLVISSNGNSTTAVSETYPTEPVTDIIQLNGYCCRQIPMGGGSFTIGLIPFATGTYTLAAGDMWGDLLLLHFAVNPNGYR